MIVLSGADLVLPDRILTPGTVVIDGGRIVEVRAGTSHGRVSSHAQPVPALHGHTIVPGFIDVHVHGVDGIDSLDGADAIGSIAARLPRYGVTAFCPTTVACAPVALRRVLEETRRARENQLPRASRVLPAHLESNFINPEFRGAQPPRCLRSPRAALPPRDSEGPSGPAIAGRARWSGGAAAGHHGRDGRGEAAASDEFSAADVLLEIERAAADVGIVTLAPELDGGIDLIRWLVARGHRVSLGHSGATYDEALAAIAAGARRATHLFNRMPVLDHRAPGLAGAVLQSDEVAAEIICDGFHVHPALVRTAIAAKRPSRLFAITDGTAASGLPLGSRVSLGGVPITTGEHAAYLDDGTMAGSVLTMDRAFQVLAVRIGLSLVDVVTMCATTAARDLGLVGHGVIAPGAVADLVILDAQLEIVRTYIDGKVAYSRDTPDTPTRHP